MSTPYDGALRSEYRLQYVAETTAGSAPSNPSWNRYSDNVRSFTIGPDAGVEGQEGTGSPDSQGAFTGTNADSIAVEYDLQQKSSSGNTLLDNSSNSNDAIADAFQRDSDNEINNTHTVVRRIKQNSIAASNTVNGSTSHDTRQYVVALGARPNGTLTGDPTDAQPTMATVEYECERVDIYQIDQPDSGTTLEVTSSSTSDTSQTLTIEDEDRNTNEDFTLSGTGTVSGSETFDNIDAAYLDAETAGDVTVSIGGGGDDLMVIQGQNSQDHGEGQLGVPTLGSSGSNASAIGQSYELYHDDSVERPDGTSIADGFETLEFSVENNFADDEQGGTPRRTLEAGQRNVTVDAAVFGETEMVDYRTEEIQTTETNVRWTMSNGGYVQADSAYVTAVDPDDDDVGQGRRVVNLTFEGQGLTLST
jgi:hypothetical protein